MLLLLSLIRVIFNNKRLLYSSLSLIVFYSPSQAQKNIYLHLEIRFISQGRCHLKSLVVLIRQRLSVQKKACNMVFSVFSPRFSLSLSRSLPLSLPPPPSSLCQEIHVGLEQQPSSMCAWRKVCMKIRANWPHGLG